jgi:hypothetical protein
MRGSRRAAARFGHGALRSWKQRRLSQIESDKPSARFRAALNESKHPIDRTISILMHIASFDEQRKVV